MSTTAIFGSHNLVCEQSARGIAVGIRVILLVVVVAGNVAVGIGCVGVVGESLRGGVCARFRPLGASLPLVGLRFHVVELLIGCSLGSSCCARIPLVLQIRIHN